MLGPNGAGKSTLIKAMLGLLPLAAGSGGACSADRPGGRTTRIGYLPQRRNFDAQTRIRGHRHRPSRAGRQRAGGFRSRACRGATQDATRVAEVIELVGATELRAPADRRALRRRAAAPADRAGARPAPGTAAPRRASRQPRPAQPGRRRGARPPDLQTGGGRGAARRPRHQPDPRLPRPGRLSRRRRAPSRAVRRK